MYPNWDFWFENIPSGNPARLPALTLAKSNKRPEHNGNRVIERKREKERKKKRKREKERKRDKKR
jgi:hypothetical protein